MNCVFEVINAQPESNNMALLEHSGAYYCSFYDANGNILEIPITEVDAFGETIAVHAETKIPCDENKEINLNIPLPSGFYYFKVFFENSFQHGTIFQRISMS